MMKFILFLSNAGLGHFEQQYYILLYYYINYIILY